MSLHTHKTRNRPGPADVLCAVLAAGIAVILAAGLGLGNGSAWELTHGLVDGAYRFAPDSTALMTSQLVRVEYHYQVAGQRYADSWEGDWPNSYSPNALSAQDIDALTQPDFPLLVWYDPANPARNQLHSEYVPSSRLWRYGTCVVSLCGWALLLWVYPRLKARWRYGTDGF